MIEADRKDFLELLGDMFGAHNQNLKAHIAGGYWKGLKHMTLGEFRAVVELVIERLQHTERGHAQIPGVSSLWDIHRSSRHGAAAGSAAAAVARYSGDHWSTAGNLLLLKHVAREHKPAGLDYAPDARGNPVVVGEHTEAIAKILTTWMNAWVIDAREAEVDGRELDRRKAWIDCMAEADKRIGEYLERYVRRAEAA